MDKTGIVEPNVLQCHKVLILRGARISILSLNSSHKTLSAVGYRFDSAAEGCLQRTLPLVRHAVFSCHSGTAGLPRYAGTLLRESNAQAEHPETPS